MLRIPCTCIVYLTCLHFLVSLFQEVIHFCEPTSPWYVQITSLIIKQSSPACHLIPRDLHSLATVVQLWGNLSRGWLWGVIEGLIASCLGDEKVWPVGKILRCWDWVSWHSSFGKLEESTGKAAPPSYGLGNGTFHRWANKTNRCCIACPVLSTSLLWFISIFPQLRPECMCLTATCARW